MNTNLNLIFIKLNWSNIISGHSNLLVFLVLNIDFVITMKAKEIRSYHIPTDEPYVENLNLVTGDKFNYDMQLLVFFYIILVW